MLAFKSRDQRPGEDVRLAYHELEELQHAYDRFRAKLASMRRDEAEHGCRSNLDDRPGGYAPLYCRDGLRPQCRRFDDGYGGGGFVA